MEVPCAYSRAIRACSGRAIGARDSRFPWALARAMPAGSVTKRLLGIPVQSTSQCKTRKEEREHCPPSGAADGDNAQSLPWQDVLPSAFATGLESNLFVTLPH